ncbi:hypothetical protein CPB85DRAFT_1432591 [Mucidula mucida]|nr:hypothetical protein CPB85DRAFT_1432591 [Mucidula mucida]
MSSPPTSPTSPTSRAKRVVPHGFLAAPKAKVKTVSQMTIRELHDRYHHNKQFLAAPGASTSTYIAKILHEQNAIETQLAELEGVDNINTSMRNTRIMDEGDMDVDSAPEPPVSRTIETKRRVLARAYGPQPGTTHVATMSMEEALEIEQRANAVDMQRRQRQEEKQARLHDITYGHMSKEEREARIWAFMHHKPSDSDMEDGSDDEDSDEDDPASWFDDDQDDGRKGQPIIEPDEPDYYDLIRVDSSRFHYNTFYEPRDDEH